MLSVTALSDAGVVTRTDISVLDAVANHIQRIVLEELHCR
jgi:hypothetical protein